MFKFQKSFRNSYDFIHIEFLREILLNDHEIVRTADCYVYACRQLNS